MIHRFGGHCFEIPLNSIQWGFNGTYNHFKIQYLLNLVSVYQRKSWSPHFFFCLFFVQIRSHQSLTAACVHLYLIFFSEPLLVLIEYVPFGDLLGYLRKSRGLNDTYYKDPDIKPKTSLTSQQLIKFAWQIADGMSYLSSKRVCIMYSVIGPLCFAPLFLVYCGIGRYDWKLLTLTVSSLPYCDVIALSLCIKLKSSCELYVKRN